MPLPSNGSSIQHICGKCFDNTGQTILYDFSLKLKPEIKVTEAFCHTPRIHGVSTNNIWDSFVIIWELCSGNDFYRSESRGQGKGHSEPKRVPYTPRSQETLCLSKPMVN